MVSEESMAEVYLDMDARLSFVSQQMYHFCFLQFPSNWPGTREKAGAQSPCRE